MGMFVTALVSILCVVVFLPEQGNCKYNLQQDYKVCQASFGAITQWPVLISVYNAKILSLFSYIADFFTLRFELEVVYILRRQPVKIASPSVA